MIRPLDEIITALALAEEELAFHGSRLTKGETTSETTSEETEHLEDLGKLYREGSRACAVLRRYQEGRLARVAPRTAAQPIDRAVTEDGELCPR